MRSGRVAADGSVVLAGPDVVRFAPDGTQDMAFGGDGRLMMTELARAVAATVPPGALTPDDSVLWEDFVPTIAPAVEADGEILLTGWPNLRGDQSNWPITYRLLRLVGSTPAGFVAVSAGAAQAGGAADGTSVTLNPAGGQLAVAGRQTYFAGFPGTVRTATADVTGDGVPDLVGGAGAGGGPNVVVFDGRTGARVADFDAFEVSFRGGVFVAAADLDGDGKAEVVVTPDRGGGPVVAVYGGAGLTAGRNEAAQVARFYGIDDPNFRGGARPAAGDVSGDGTADLVVAAGHQGGPRVAVFDGASVAAGAASPVKLVADFFAFEDTLRNGTFVAAGDVTGDGKAEVAFGGGPGGGPRVRVFDGAGLLAAGPFARLDELGPAQVANFFAGGDAPRGGVRVALRDADGDGSADLVAGSGEGEPSRVRVYRAATLRGGATPAPDQEFDPYGATAMPEGVFVG